MRNRPQDDQLRQEFEQHKQEYDAHRDDYIQHRDEERQRLDRHIADFEREKQLVQNAYQIQRGKDQAQDRRMQVTEEMVSDLTDEVNALKRRPNNAAPANDPRVDELVRRVGADDRNVVDDSLQGQINSLHSFIGNTNALANEAKQQADANKAQIRANLVELGVKINKAKNSALDGLNDANTRIDELEDRLNQAQPGQSVDTSAIEQKADEALQLAKSQRRYAGDIANLERRYSELENALDTKKDASDHDSDMTIARRQYEENLIALTNVKTRLNDQQEQCRYIDKPMPANLDHEIKADSGHI